MNVAHIVKGAQRVISNNSPTILTGMGVLGTITTVIFAVKGTIKAVRILDHEAEIRQIEWAHQTGEDPSSYPEQMFTNREIVEYTWKCYIPAAGLGAVTIAAIIGSNHINLRRRAALLSLYTMTEKAMSEYERKVVETIGEKKASGIKEEIAQETLNKKPVENEEVIFTGKGKTLMFDKMSGRYFRSDLEFVRKVVNDFNKDIISDGSKTLNEFYYELGLESVQMGDYMGWGTDYGFLEIDYKTKIAGSEPCIVLEYKIEPTKY